MNSNTTLLTVALAGLLAVPAAAQDKLDAKPLLRLEAGGPTSNVTSLAFAPDGKTLYAAGYDKVVRGWVWNAEKKAFALDDAIAFRVPIGPGLDGAINALAISEDGRWLAVGGFGVVGEGMKFTEAGRLIPVKGGLTPEMRAERGQIVVFDTRDRSVKTLRGHTGPVLSLAFARNSKDAPRLLSAAEGWDAATAKVVGEAKAWDVAQEKTIGSRAMPALSFARRPGLAMCAMPDKARTLRAFLAWEDGTLVRWDVDSGKAENLPAPKMNVGLDLGPANAKLAMTGMEGVTGVLKSIAVDGNGLAAKVELPSPGKSEFDLPLAVRFCDTNPHAAMVVRRWKDGTPTSDSLWIVPDHLGAWANPAAKIPLGDGNRILPTLAASNEHIAVGGFPDHRIVVFAIKDAIAGKASPQILRGAGATMRSVAFVKKGEARGLALSETVGAAKGDVVLDLHAGKLSPQVAGWVDDAAAAGDYRLAVAGLKATLSKADQILSTSTAKEGAITATAISPPLGVDVPLVAIASYIPAKGTTLLELSNGATGQTLRRFVGHTAPIRGLSFRADGKLLASTADDQTTIVWSLTDLAEIIGKHGSLGDLSVETKGKDLTVIDAAGVAGVAEGDVVRGLYDKAGKLQAFATPGAFYEALWLKKPNQKVTLRIDRAGAANDVAVAVLQGVDVRKPLFSLFLPRDAAGKLGDWLGWNAIGPYDSSRRDVEQYLGWHFNTGRADRPTSFAFIDQYRKEYFRPGLLKELAELGDLPAAPKAPAPKSALLVPGISEDGALLPRVAGEFLVRKKAVELNVTIPSYEYIRGDELTWELEGGPSRPLEPVDVNLWSAKVDLPPGPAPTRNVTVRMKRTPEGWPAMEQRVDLTLRVVSPPPKIALANPKTAEAIKTDKPAFAIAVRFEAGEPGVAYRALVSQEVQGKRVGAREVEPTADAATVDLAMTLQPGLNLVRVRAVNDRAIDRDREEQEAATLTIPVTYVEKKTLPPEFVFESLVPTGSTEKLPIGGRSAKVDAPTATLYGRIVSEEPLASAEFDVAPAGKRPIAGLDLAKPGAFKVDVALKPGNQRVKFSAKTVGGAVASSFQEITYRPRLPRLVVVGPEEGFTARGEGDLGETKVEVRWPLDEANPKESYPVTVEAEVFSQGKRIGRDEAIVELTLGKAAFEKLPLAPGDNEIRVRMRHGFGGDDEVRQVHGRYVRPPRISSLAAGPIGKTPFVDVTAEVISPLAPAVESVAATVNGKAVRPANVDVRKGKDGRTWQVVAAQIPLAHAKGKETASDIGLSLATADGEARASLKEPVRFAAPLPAIPDVTLLEPALRDATVSEPAMKVRFKVASETPPTRVELLRGDSLVQRWDAPPPTADGVHEFAVASVPLDWGVNSLRVLAWNDGGVRTVPLNVNVPPQPVRVDIDRIEIAPTGLRFQPEPSGNFAPLPVGRVVLQGSVRWNSYDDANLQKAKQVRMFVNGFQQLPVELKPAVGKSRERRFEVPVVLNFASNEVEIDLPELKQDAANRRRLTIDCRQPIRGQHLHVLVIAPQEKDDAKLVENLARGIKAQPLGSGIYKTPVFEVVHFYVLARHVQLLEISSRLDRIADSLKDRARAGNPNDLVMIYFQGKETVGADGPVLWTSETAPWLQLTLKDLSKNYLTRFSGGQVLILDTVAQAGDIDFRGSRFAFLRRPDPRPLADATRLRLSTELEKEIPRVVWLDQLTNVLAVQVGPSFQSYLPDPLKNRIQLNPN